MRAQTVRATACSLSRLTLSRALIVATGLALAGCLGGDTGPPGDRSERRRADRLTKLGLATRPPANLIEACRKVARQTDLTVYCPPVVPEGRVDAPTPKHRRGNAYVDADDSSYFLSLQSESLVDADRASDYDPDGPPVYVRSRGRRQVWDPFAAKHWVVSANADSRLLRRAVDERLLFPGGKHESRPRHLTVEGIRAIVLTGDVAGSGDASRDHAIVFWRFEGTGYMASVHFDDQAPIAEEIARGLIRQMVDCAPRSPDRESPTCDWVFDVSRRG